MLKTNGRPVEPSGAGSLERKVAMSDGIRCLRALDGGRSDPWKEQQVLARVLLALDEALESPDLSIDWRDAFQIARRHLAGDAGLPRESPRRMRLPAPQ